MFGLVSNFAICKHPFMDTSPPSPDLAEKLRSIGISESYASQIVNGRRAPSMPLALRINREIGIKLGPLAGVADDDIPVLERVHAQSDAAA